ncbi:MAG: sugar phosphate isomerase/epimerase [Bacteroidota bacterium]
MTINEYSRKDFLRLLGISAASMAFSRIKLPEEKKYIPDIGFQLYTVRRELEKDFDTAIHKVADMGYLGAEMYPLPSNVTPEHAVKVFKDAGLKIFSMHTDLPVGDEREKIVKLADIYRCNHIIYPGWPKGLSTDDPDLYKHADEIFNTLDKIKQRAETYNEIGEFFSKKGLHFGIHNHWWEFETLNGVIPFYYFKDHVKAPIFFEIDTYWAKTGGVDPAKAVADFGKRVPFLHIKDGPAIKGPTMFAQVPAGQGALDFPSIVKAGGKNIQWMIVEFDEYAGNIFEGLQRSYTYLTKNELAKGKV